MSLHVGRRLIGWKLAHVGRGRQQLDSLQRRQNTKTDKRWRSTADNSCARQPDQTTRKAARSWSEMNHKKRKKTVDLVGLTQFACPVPLRGYVPHPSAGASGSADGLLGPFFPLVNHTESLVAVRRRGRGLESVSFYLFRRRVVGHLHPAHFLVQPHINHILFLADNQWVYMMRLTGL